MAFLTDNGAIIHPLDDARGCFPFAPWILNRLLPHILLLELGSKLSV